MDIENCPQNSPLAGVKLIKTNVLGDSRGFFIERFHAVHYAAAGLPVEYVQDNHSRSAPGILRGLHYQHTPAQGKLVGIIRGKVWDVVVDIRPDSPTYGQSYGVELSGENGRMLWIPSGFAHGFCVLGDEPVDMLYKVTTLYNPAGEGGIRYDDPTLAIDWPIRNPQVSERDKHQPSWSEYRANPPVWGAQ
jgi:dTDP-4-dehydrorhamnose 3,5-epimerase